MPSLFEAQIRHAEFYLHVLEHADELYLQGDDALVQGLTLLDISWPNIQRGQAWAAGHMASDGPAVRICSDYPNLGRNCLALRQHPREQIQWLLIGFEAARKLKRRSTEGIHLGNLGTAHVELGDYKTASSYFRGRLGIAREIGDRRGEHKVLSNLGVTYKNMGEPQLAIDHYLQCLEILRETKDQRSEAIVLGNLVQI